MRRWFAAASAAAALSAVAAVPAPAQQMRDFTTARQHHGESRLSTRLEFSAGSLRLAPGTRDELYRMRLSYDPQRFVPVSRFEPASSVVTLGVEGTGKSGIRVSSREHLQQAAAITLSPDVTLALDVALGAVEADLELGGLRLAAIHLETGASRSVVRFSRSNPIRCSTATIEAGAAEIEVLGLGNSRCERVTFDGGVGKAVLDLGGAWNEDSKLTVAMTVGELTLRLPRDLGIRIVMDRFLSSFPSKGWVREGSGDTWLTPGYARARRRVDIALSSTMGGVRVEWLPSERNGGGAERQ